MIEELIKAWCNRALQEEIYSSSYAAAAYLESINFEKKVISWLD